MHHSTALATAELERLAEPQTKDLEVSCDEDCRCGRHCPCQELGGCWSKCRCRCHPPMHAHMFPWLDR